MGETLTTIVVIVVAAGLLFIFPMSAISEMNDKEVLALVQSYTTEFKNEVCTSRILTQEKIDEFSQKLNATGNSYEIEIELHISDTNPGKKTEDQRTGDVVYYVLYNSQVEKSLENGGIINLKEGDYIVVYVKNTNTTISQMFIALFYGASGNQSYSIFCKDSGPVY